MTPARSLETYRSMRDFAASPEPAGETPAADGRRFVVQKHAARRLHFDFRLEWGGALLSWAVTRGPSRDPAAKRLAVRTEDHPVEYADFEGVIPAAQYGAGTVMLWDAGAWAPEGDVEAGLEAGKLKFTLAGSRMRGGWTLVRMKPRQRERGENWLLIKERDAEAAEGTEALVEAHSTSVATGRTMAEIAAGEPAKSREPRKAKARPPGVGTALATGTRIEKAAGKAPVETTPARKGQARKPRVERPPVEKPLVAGAAKAAMVKGQRISSPERQVYHSPPVTKLEVAEHYAALAERILRFAGKRPVSLLRCPDGTAGECFFQKHRTPGMPKAVGAVRVSEVKGGEAEYLTLPSAAALLGAAQMGAIEIHIWGSRNDRLETPDRMVFDLDPDEGLGFARLRAAAVDLRDRLNDLGLPSIPMLTGGKGVHVVVPLRPAAEWETVKLFARTFAVMLATNAPSRYTATMAKKDRAGRIFIDWLRNERGSTAVAPYSLRARPGAKVAVPVAWDELARLRTAGAYDIRSVRERLATPCPLREAGKRPPALSPAMIARLERAADRGA